MSMEKNSGTNTMAEAGKLIRLSIFTFLQHYQYFTSIVALLAVPFSLSVLLSQAFFPPSFSLLPSLYSHLLSIFPSPSSAFFSLITLKLSQSLFSSLLTLPFSLSFLLFAKAAAFHHLLPRTPVWKLYHSLLSTHLWNILLIFSVNSIGFSLLLLIFTSLEQLGTTAPIWSLLVLATAAVVYSVAIANATVVCAVASAYSGVEGRGGFRAIIEAYTAIRNRTPKALAMAAPTSLGLAAIEALFHFRIINFFEERENYSTSSNKQLWLMSLEAVFIAYLYSIFLALDVIMSCFFYQSCKADRHNQTEDRKVEEEEDGNRDEHDNQYSVNPEKLKGLQEIV